MHQYRRKRTRKVVELPDVRLGSRPHFPILDSTYSYVNNLPDAREEKKTKQDTPGASSLSPDVSDEDQGGGSRLRCPLDHRTTFRPKASDLFSPHPPSLRIKG